MFRFVVLGLSLLISWLSAAEFTISSYNCGGLSEHYDYLRAVNMEKLMQERYTAEPSYMALNETIQKVALKKLFMQEPQAKQEWKAKDYRQICAFLTKVPSSDNSINKVWHEKCEAMLSGYQVRPVALLDSQVKQALDAHISDLVKDSSNATTGLEQARRVMAQRIFANHLKFDIICLQEADYLDPFLFPEKYAVHLTEGRRYSKNGIAWNTERFDLVDTVGDFSGRAYVVVLRDKQTQKTVLVASGHFTGCNPYRAEKDQKTGKLDSAKGDSELQAVVDFFEGKEADIKIIGMDSNVTSLHPRLRIVKKAGYTMDCENYIEPTCTNPYQVLNTRIDWIVLKSALRDTSITNIPVLSVGLNSMQTNMSDHKPIAAKVQY